jgi:hypothetical protein
MGIMPVRMISREADLEGKVEELVSGSPHGSTILSRSQEAWTVGRGGGRVFTGSRNPGP